MPMSIERIYNLLVIEQRGLLSQEEVVELEAYRNSQTADVAAVEHLILHTANLEFPTDDEISNGWSALESAIRTETIDNKPTVSKNRRITAGRRRWFALAASFILLALAYMVYGDQSETYVSKDGMLQQMLADNSEVRLNENSMCRLKKGYGAKHRNLEIKGELFIKAKEHDHEMHLQSEQFDIVVKGTQFNVMDFEADDIATVTLYEGRINLTLPTGETLRMNAGDHVCWNKSKRSATRTSVRLTEPGWVSGKFVFDHAPWPEVFARLSRKFNVSFIGIDALADSHFNDDATSDDLDSILRHIERASHSRITALGEAQYQIDVE